MNFKRLCSAVFVSTATLMASPFTVTPVSNATQLAQMIVGSGVTLTGTPTLTGVAGQAGTFSGFTTGTYTNPVTGTTGTINIPSGVILSTGSVEDAVGDYSGGASRDMGGAGDAGLDALAGYPTHDAAVLEFSFVPDANEIFIQYLFASTEYPTFVNSQFNDVFAFLVNGNNVALVPGSATPVTINSINAGNPTGTDASNPQYFTQYSTDTTPFNYGGTTVLLTARAAVNRGVTNTFRFAIADASDSILDAAVLLGAGNISTENPDTPHGAVPEPSTWALLGGGLGVLVLRRRFI